MTETDHVQTPPPGDPTVMSHARAYNFVLGGKDNYPVDREGAEAVMAMAPDLPVLGKAQTRFYLRLADLCARQGIDQVLDIGSGIPVRPYVHEIARATLPDARVVYADYDPLVTVMNNALPAKERGVVAIEADVRDPEALLGHEKVRSLIDFDKPVLMLFIGLFHLVTDAEDPRALMAAYRDRMAPGSYAAITQFSSDGSDAAARATLEQISEGSPSPMCFRSKAEILPFFDGFELLEPGLVDSVQEWWPRRNGPAAEGGPVPRAVDADWWRDESIPETGLKCAAGVGIKRA
ncbi:hypothetical protein BIV57_08560 [Mangrovactinospora gilvigrisea]|uniref:SAM-dependent methyltransferase n=1 Tax=Mangrovactinospora gilvigrisea TaxID=1428644 RepID=A0A1J7CDZ8_9ACTN|nr:SAM-dependent methyltransferase [Mangrovactinospora gilvigrisea]OIV37898.1 hypothetical protein BIV57_08560 [Mangrovactinospora gilvigrisea]